MRRFISLGDVIAPVECDAATLSLSTMTLAELLRAAGVFVDLAAGASTRDHEVALEKIFVNYGLSRYVAAREVTAANPWLFVVSDPVDAERVLGRLSA